jgi:drug/metabolite transporter (DMT)-like permease
MGPVLCLASAAGFGTMAIFGKLAYSAGVSPGALLLIRFTLAAVLLATLLLARPSRRRMKPAPPATTTGRKPASRQRVLAIAVGLGAIGYASQASLCFAALERMNASLLSLILYTYPIMVTVAAVLLGRDRLTPARGIALVAASAGTLLVLLAAGTVSFDPLGALLGFGSAVAYTTYILVSDTIVHRLSPVLLSTLVMAGAAATLALRAVLTGGVDFRFGPAGWFWLICMALVSTVAAMLAFFAGLERTGPSTAAILSTFEPVVTTALAALILGESLTALQLAGGALVLASVAVLQIRRHHSGSAKIDTRPKPAAARLRKLPINSPASADEPRDRDNLADAVARTVSRAARFGKAPSTGVDRPPSTLATRTRAASAAAPPRPRSPRSTDRS